MTSNDLTGNFGGWRPKWGLVLQEILLVSLVAVSFIEVMGWWDVTSWLFFIYCWQNLREQIWTNGGSDDQFCATNLGRSHSSTTWIIGIPIWSIQTVGSSPAHRLKHEEVGSHCCDPALRNQEGMNLWKSDMAIKAIGWESPSAVSEMWRLIGISHPMIIIILVTGGEKWIML